ncbi:MAG TPA: TolC family protein [Anaeromyxobacteraceae bacterium]|nr:TolC family protein [Anaeromyxobacteraceae bacterium]
MTVAPLLLLLAAAPATPPPAPVAPQALTLDDAVRLARENAPALRAARASADAAGARADQSLAPLLLQLSGSAGLERATSNPSLFGSPRQRWDMANSLSLSATATQTLVDLPAFARYGAARASARAQEGSSRAAELDAILAVRTAFFQARASKELVGVARAALDNQEAHYRQIEAFVQQGLRPPIDLAQARTDRANARAQLVGAENDYATARVRLNQAMGVIGPTDYEVADPPFAPIPGEDRPLDPLLSEAIAARPDVAAMDAQVTAAERSLDAARGGWFPKVGLSAGASEGGAVGSDLTWNAYVGGTATWALFQGGLTRAQVAEARALLEAQRAQRDQLVQQVRGDVDTARLGVVAALALLDADREAVEAARDRLRLAEARYANGAGSALELSDAQLARTNAEAQLVQAEYKLAQARAALLRALGRA